MIFTDLRTSPGTLSHDYDGFFQMTHTTITHVSTNAHLPHPSKLEWVWSIAKGAQVTPLRLLFQKRDFMGSHRDTRQKLSNLDRPTEIGMVEHSVNVEILVSQLLLQT